MGSVELIRSSSIKRVSYAVMNEPSKGDVINEGIMKEITGGDPIQARELYKQILHLYLSLN